MEKDRDKGSVVSCCKGLKTKMHAFVFVPKQLICYTDCKYLPHAYLGWEHINWAQKAPLRWYRLSTGYCWRDRVWAAGAECCCTNRLVLQGLKGSAVRGAWWVGSGRIKCFLETLQGKGRRGKCRKDSTESRDTQTCTKKTTTWDTHLGHHAPPRHTRQERQTGKHSEKLKLCACANINPHQPSRCTHMDVHMDA